jgi:hypothetical protein
LRPIIGKLPEEKLGAASAHPDGSRTVSPGAGFASTLRMVEASAAAFKQKRIEILPKK